MAHEKGERKSRSDLISKLPDDSISHILSFLPTKFAVATSILSSRYNNLWTLVPSLDFDDCLYLYENPDTDQIQEMETLFTEFIDKVLSSNRLPKLCKFRLKFYDYEGKFISSINRWIEDAVKRDVVEMDLCVTVDTPSNDYLVIPPCESLQVLSIDALGGYSVFVSTAPVPFPNLRFLDLGLSLNEDPKDIICSELLPNLPQIEAISLYVDFHFEDFNSRSFYIIGNSLRSLDVQFRGDGFDVVVLVDAPNLQYIILNDDFICSRLSFVHLECDSNHGWPDKTENRFRVGAVNLPTALQHAFIDVGQEDLYFEVYNDGDDLTLANSSLQLVQSVSSTKSLKISLLTYVALMCNDERLPMFKNLTKLELALCRGGGWDLLPLWLKKCPKLEILILEEDYKSSINFAAETYWRAPRSVPKCLISHLKQVEITGLRKLATRGFLKYLLDNSKVLEKLTLGPYENDLDDGLSSLLMEFRDNPASNSMCQVLLWSSPGQI